MSRRITRQPFRMRSREDEEQFLAYLSEQYGRRRAPKILVQVKAREAARRAAAQLAREDGWEEEERHGDSGGDSGADVKRRSAQDAQGWQPVRKLSRGEMERLRFLHREQGVSRGDLAALFSISYSAVLRILRSSFQPSPEAARRQQRTRAAQRDRRVEERHVRGEGKARPVGKRGGPWRDGKDDGLKSVDLSLLDALPSVRTKPLPANLRVPLRQQGKDTDKDKGNGNGKRQGKGEF